MTIKILSFTIIERYVIRDTYFNKFCKWLSGKYESDKYHYDCVIKVDESYASHTRELMRDDVLRLPNKVRLMVWSVDRFGIIKAKTYKFIEEDLRNYHPMEMYLVYPRVHGNINNIAS